MKYFIQLIILCLWIFISACSQEASLLESYFIVQESAESAFKREAPENLENILISWQHSALLTEKESGTFDSSLDLWLIHMRLYALYKYKEHYYLAQKNLELAQKEYLDYVPGVPPDRLAKKCLSDWIYYEKETGAPSWLNDTIIDLEKEFKNIE